MGRISLLDDAVINKIAAGEVVDRPASVVKELVENALDAGAETITVILEQGGCRRIIVTDDGTGMEPADAELALVRHATSKIHSANDLFEIGTMGFRGEALASIAAVSRFSLMTRERQAPEGIKLVVETAADAAVHNIQRYAWSGATGTTMVVEDLFYNVPVRAKFLKAPASEFAQCLEVMQSLVLAHPRVTFTLVHNSKEHLRAPAVGADADHEQAMRQRAAAVLGKEVAQSLVYAQAEQRYGKLHALVSPPGVEKGSGRFMFGFVNRRAVKDRVVRYGILRGYQTHLLRGRFPVVIAHLTVDPSLVDVNVHPAKTELRFQYADEVQSLIALTIREALRRGEWAQKPDAGSDAAVNSMQAVSTPLPTTQIETKFEEPKRAGASAFLPERVRPLANFVDAGRGAKQEAKQEVKWRTTMSTPTNTISTAKDAASELGGFSGTSTWSRPKTSSPSYQPVVNAGDLDALLGNEGSEQVSKLATASAPSSTVVSRAIPWDELEYLGAIDRCYLLFSHGRDLLALDQHAFHERVLFERLVRNQALLTQSQRLLVPESLELSPTESASLELKQAALQQRGFRFSVDAPGLITVHSVPSLLARSDLLGLFSALARDPDPDSSTGNAELAEHLLATMACHAAVRAGEELGANELKLLLREALDVDFYHNCPHGRRVFRWWAHEQVAGWFDR